MRATAGLPFLLEEGDEVAFVPPQTDMPRRAVVTDVRLIDDASAEVAFDGVGIDEARALVGCHCLIRRAEIGESTIAEEPAFWDGWKVVDDALGDVGVVAGVIDNPSQSLLEVARPDGQGEVLVPIVDDIVVDVDTDARTVHVALPKGLLELN